METKTSTGARIRCASAESALRRQTFKRKSPSKAFPQSESREKLLHSDKTRHALDRTLPLTPFTLDQRGNAIALKSFGHRLHPCNRCDLRAGLRWADLVEKVLEHATFGLRMPLASSIGILLVHTNDPDTVAHLFAQRSSNEASLPLFVQARRSGP